MARCSEALREPFRRRSSNSVADDWPRFRGVRLSTTALAILQENSKKLDNVVRDFRRGLSEVIMLVLQLYHQFKPNIVFAVQGPESGSVIMQTWNAVGDESLRRRIVVEATASTASLNKAVAKTELTTLFTQMVSYYDRYQQLIVMGEGGQDPQTGQLIPPDPRLKDFAIRQGAGMNMVMERVLDASDIKNRDQLLIPVELISAPPTQPGVGGEAFGGVQPGFEGALDELVTQAGQAGIVPQPQSAPNRPFENAALFGSSPSGR